MAGDDFCEKRAMVVFTKHSPYTAVDVGCILDADGNAVAHGPAISLCRCGLSERKPCCDGSHSEKGIRGEKLPGRVRDRVKDYAGKEIVIHDNRGVCSHDGACITLLPAVFRKDLRPWIDPDAAPVDEIVAVIDKCPSGALACSVKGARHPDPVRPPAIRAAADGPFELTGGVLIRDDQDSRPQSAEHCCLCRCGETKNTPFCDGSHEPAGFRG